MELCLSSGDGHSPCLTNLDFEPMRPSDASRARA
jgi:hypothetical protein